MEITATGLVLLLRGRLLLLCFALLFLEHGEEVMVLGGYLIVPLAQFLIVLHQLVVLPDNFVLLLN